MSRERITHLVTLVRGVGATTPTLCGSPLGASERYGGRKYTFTGSLAGASWATVALASESEASLWIEGDAICVACCHAHAKSKQPVQLSLIRGGR
jgi:hypothetical protein